MRAPLLLRVLRPDRALTQFDPPPLTTVHRHGCGRRTDITQLLPSSTMAVDMVPNSVGEWMLHCHVSAHMMRGMIVTVLPDP